MNILKMVHTKKKSLNKTAKNFIYINRWQGSSFANICLKPHPNVRKGTILRLGLLEWEHLEKAGRPTGGLMGSHAVVLCVAGVFPLVSLSSRVEVS